MDPRMFLGKKGVEIPVEEFAGIDAPALAKIFRKKNRKGRNEEDDPSQVGFRGTGFFFPASLSYNFLEGSVVPKSGSAVPGFTRTTERTFVDFENLVRYADVGEAVILEGGRRVKNFVTENLLDGTWTAIAAGTGSAGTVAAGFIAPDGTPSAFRVQGSLNGGGAAGDQSGIRSGGAQWNRAGFTTNSAWIKSNNGLNQSILMRVSGAAAAFVVPVTNEWRRVGTVPTSVLVAGDTQGYTIATRGTLGTSDTFDVLVWHPQMEEVVIGQSNLAPSEYVSRGVLSSPFHGCYVDGVKYFPYENGNTLVSQVVTEARGADIDPTILLKGWSIWEARTNLQIRNNEFDDPAWTLVDSVITPNNIEAPSGEILADLITEGVAGTASVSQAVVATADINYAVSRCIRRGNHDWVFLRVSNGANGMIAWYNLALGIVGSTTVLGTGALVSSTIEPLANGFYRCKLVASVGSAAVNITSQTSSATGDAVTVRVNNATRWEWGAQFENNVGAIGKVSPIIPTLAVPVTRNADLPAAVLVNDFNFNPTEGTLVTEIETGETTGPTTGTYVWSIISDNTTNNRLNRRVVGANAGDFLTQAGGVTQAFLGVIAVAANTIYKTADAYKENSMASSVNGGAVSTDNVAIIPVVDRLQFGAFGAGNFANAWLRKIEYYPARRPDAYLPLHSTP